MRTALARSAAFGLALVAGGLVAALLLAVGVPEVEALVAAWVVFLGLGTLLVRRQQRPPRGV